MSSTDIDAIDVGASSDSSSLHSFDSEVEVEVMLRKASEARVNSRLRRYYLIVLLLPSIFTLACLLLISI